MEKQFDLMLVNQRREWWLLILSLFVGLVCALFLFQLASFISDTEKASVRLFLLFVIPSWGAILMAYLKLSCDSALVTIGADKLTVFYRKSNKSYELSFTEIIAHNSGRVKGGAFLTLEYKGVTTALTAVYRTDSFLKMAAQFDEAFYRFKFGHDKPAPIYKGPAFFRHPIAGFILIGLGISAVALTKFLPDFSDSRSLILAGYYIAVIIYYVVWVSAKEQQPQKR